MNIKGRKQRDTYQVQVAAIPPPHQQPHQPCNLTSTAPSSPAQAPKPLTTEWEEANGRSGREAARRRRRGGAGGAPLSVTMISLDRDGEDRKAPYRAAAAVHGSDEQTSQPES